MLAQKWVWPSPGTRGPTTPNLLPTAMQSATKISMLALNFIVELSWSYKKNIYIYAARHTSHGDVRECAHKILQFWIILYSLCSQTYFYHGLCVQQTQQSRARVEPWLSMTSPTSAHSVSWIFLTPMRRISLFLLPHQFVNMPHAGAKDNHIQGRISDRYLTVLE